ncbi:hypothetical protein RF673_08000 [Limosilactobacillus fermentum]|uniref:hypothetical protein n=1 Tax=Limosilactobacillus fermentum TaxID=1613 RepID=UPI00285A0D1B|nr:hypothetical protein [Limosilactobacillus fermentum]MDR7663611.1 hypothetical protein [Limosilactobacillus fermentum]MDR7663661.1 hypothetical protein [Limosilactobacillus fermentum]
MHRPFGFDWGELVSIVTLIGVVMTYVKTSITNAAHDSNKAEFDRLGDSIAQLNQTMIKVNMVLDSLKADRESANRRLDKIEATTDRHDIQLARIEEHVMTNGDK